MNLNAEQAAAFDKLSRLKCGALFMAMGTGKTKVALDLVKSKQAVIDCVIWIAPASLLREENYHAEINKWTDGLTKPIRFFSVEGISASDVKYLEMLSVARSNRCFCVVDESITIKNTEAGRTKRLLDNYALFDFRLILNGTPLTKGLIDLYAQIQFLSPKILNMTEAQFANKFLCYKKDGWKPWKRWSRPENEEALIEIIRPYIFDADLDIPVALEEKDFDFDLTAAESEAYGNMKAEFLSGKYEVGFLEAAQKFQNFYTNCTAKREALQSLITEIRQRGEKVIIYVKFLKEASALSDMLDCVVLTGGRKDDLSAFKADKDILLCTYGVGSLGLNLQHANNVIYYSQTFDYKDKEQSKHRVYRTGQTRDVNIINFWVNVGLDNLIRKSLSKKQGVLQNVEKIISKEKALTL